MTRAEGSSWRPPEWARPRTIALASGISGASAAETKRRPGSAQEPVLAVVTDHKSNELRLLVGEREVVVHDRDLVTRILNAAGGK